MKYKLLFVVLLIINNTLFINNALFGFPQDIELYQVVNNTGSDIQLDLEFKQTLEFGFNRADFELIDQEGLKYPNSVRKYPNSVRRKSVKENRINIKPDETISLFSISWTKITEEISPVEKFSQLLSLLEVRDGNDNVIYNLEDLKSDDILEIPYSVITYIYVLRISDIQSGSSEANSK